MTGVSGRAFILNLLTLISCATTNDRTVDERTGSPATRQFAVRREVPKEARGRLMDVTQPPDIAGLATGAVRPPTAEESMELLNKEAGDWFYGQGLGEGILNIGTIVVFPPYAIYILGNAGLRMSGYEPYYMTDALGPQTKKKTLEFYSDVTSVPGKITSTIAGEEFRSKKPEK